MSQAFTTRIEAGIAELTIAKPPVNALDSQEWLGLARSIDELGANPEVRVIVIRAEGRGFCAGVDIKELDAHPERIVAVNKGNYETFRAVHRSPVPVIVAVHGFVLGGGIGITGAADIVVAAECATFALPEVDRGAMGGGAHLQRLFPVQKVRMMYFTGEPITAAEAYRLGAVEKVVPKDQLRDAAPLLAERRLPIEHVLYDRVDRRAIAAGKGVFQLRRGAHHGGRIHTRFKPRSSASGRANV